MKILGIDPGSRVTGYGVIRCETNRIRYVDSGCIRMKSGEIPSRLSRIYHGISEVIAKHEPQVAVVEKVFISVNVKSALVLGQARGGAICACSAGNLDVFEYSAREIKKSVTGSGAAAKEQVQYMVQMLLQLASLPDVDEADALAGAITHYQHLSVLDSTERAHRRDDPPPFPTANVS